jgi:hypothetical protein
VLRPTHQRVYVPPILPFPHGGSRKNRAGSSVLTWRALLPPHYHRFHHRDSWDHNRSRAACIGSLGERRRPQNRTATTANEPPPSTADAACGDAGKSAAVPAELRASIGILPTAPSFVLASRSAGHPPARLREILSYLRRWERPFSGILPEVRQTPASAPIGNSARVRSGRPLSNGHGGRALDRLKAALLTG